MPACQRERRRRWQQNKRQNDPDYRDNQARAQQAWAERHPDYWRTYRSGHPDYVERNRLLQHKRNVDRDMIAVVKMDAAPHVLPWPSGVCQLRVLAGPTGKKKNVWIVEIRLIPEQPDGATPDCKERT
jgi:hypothetical protein